MDDLTKSIATDLGIADLPQNEQQILIAQFGEVALKAASLAVMEKLPDEKRAAFIALAQAGDPTAVQEYLNKELPDHENIARAAVQQEVASFKAAQAA